MPSEPDPKAADAALRALAARLSTAVVHLNRRLRRADVALGLPPAQASALALLVAAGPHTLGDLARFEHVAAPTMTRIVSSLEERGLAARTRRAADQRQVEVEATRAGRTLIERGRAERLAALETDLARLNPADLATLAAAVETLLELANGPAEADHR